MNLCRDYRPHEKLPLVVFLSQQCKEEDQTLAKHHDVNAAQFADKRSFLLQFSFFFEGKIYIQLLNIDKSFAASAFLKKIIGLISYLENNYLLYNIVFVY